MIRAARPTTLSLAALALFATLLPRLAMAQADIPDMPRPGEKKGRTSSGPAVQHATPSLSTAARVAWPRLDAGTTVCRTRDDLRAHAQVIQARSDGTTYSGNAPDCRILGFPVAIDILTRESPGATQVKLKDGPGGIGWTDTWLPSQPPR